MFIASNNIALSVNCSSPKKKKKLHYLVMGHTMFLCFIHLCFSHHNTFWVSRVSLWYWAASFVIVLHVNYSFLQDYVKWVEHMFLCAEESYWQFLHRGQAPMSSWETQRLCVWGLSYNTREIHQHVCWAGWTKEHEVKRPQWLLCIQKVSAKISPRLMITHTCSVCVSVISECTVVCV